MRVRNYWIYSTGLAIAWAIVLFLTRVVGGRESARTTRLVFLGFCGWLSTTIARYVYVPPNRWTSAADQG